MPTSSAKASIGTTFKWNGYVVAEVFSIGAPGFTTDLIDVTSYSSPDNFKEYIAGLKDGDELTIEMNFIPSDTNGQIAFLTDVNNGTLREAIITGPNALFTWTFNAVPRGFKPSFDLKGQLKASGVMKISGKPALGYMLATGPDTLVVTGSVTDVLTLTPVYAAGVYEYVADGTGDVTVTVTVTAGGADLITVNGAAIGTGVPTSAITLTEDGITTITVVVGEDNKVSRVYVFKITGPAS